MLVSLSKYVGILIVLLQYMVLPYSIVFNLTFLALLSLSIYLTSTHESTRRGLLQPGHEGGGHSNEVDSVR